jgi:hypothetical protein
MVLDVRKSLLPVDTSNNLSAPKVLGWNGYKYIVAVASGTFSGAGDGSTKTFSLGQEDIVHGTLVVKVNNVTKTEGTDYTVDYKYGKITFATAPGNAVPVTATFSYFAADPSAILIEDVSAGQNPPYALCLIMGEYPNFSLLADVRYRLQRNGIYIFDPKTA